MHFALFCTIMAISLAPTVSYIAIPAFSATAALLTAMRRRESISIKKDKLTLFILAGILATAIISIIASNTDNGIYTTIRGSARFLLYIGFALVIYKIGITYLKKAIILITLALSATLPLSSALSVTEAIGDSQRYQYIFEHPNHFGYFLTPFLIYFLSIEKNFVFKILGLITVISSLILTKSSGALLTAFLITSLFFSKNAKTIIYGLIISTTLIITLSTLGFLDKIVTQVTSFSPDELSSRVDSENFGGSGSLAWRFVYWGAIWNALIIEEWQTLLFGLGYGAMTYGSYEYSFMYTDPHNDYLKTLAENGMLGLSLLLLSLFKLSTIRTHERWLILCGTAVPMFFGNVLTNAPFIMAMTMVTVISIKTENAKQSG